MRIQSKGLMEPQLNLDHGLQWVLATYSKMLNG